MVKSLYGYERFQNHKAIHEKELGRNHYKFEGKIIEVISNYKQLADSQPRMYEELMSGLGTDYTTRSGLHFVVLLENDELCIVPSPCSEDEIRSIYGSDANIKGRLIEIEAFDMSLASISQAKKVSFKNSSEILLEDNDKYLPVVLAGLFGARLDFTNKMNRFKYNSKSGRGF